MSKIKAEATLEAITGFNTKFHDMQENAQLEIAKLEGMKNLSFQIVRTLEKQVAQIDVETTEGKFDLETKAHIKRYIKQTFDIINNALPQIESNIYLNKGKLVALEQVTKETERAISVEKSKLKALEDMERSGTDEFMGHPIRRPPGIRPADPLAERRAATDNKENTPEQSRDDATPEPAGPVDCHFE